MKTEYHPRLGPHAIPSPRRPRTLEDSSLGPEVSAGPRPHGCPRGLDQGRREASVPACERTRKPVGPELPAGLKAGGLEDQRQLLLRLKWDSSIHHPPARSWSVRARRAHWRGRDHVEVRGGCAPAGTESARARGGGAARTSWRPRRREGRGKLEGGGGEGRGGRGDGKRQEGEASRAQKTTTREKWYFCTSQINDHRARFDKLQPHRAPSSSLRGVRAHSGPGAETAARAGGPGYQQPPAPAPSTCRRSSPVLSHAGGSREPPPPTTAAGRPRVLLSRGRALLPRAWGGRHCLPLWLPVAPAPAAAAARAAPGARQGSCARPAREPRPAAAPPQQRAAAPAGPPRRCEAAPATPGVPSGVAPRVPAAPGRASRARFGPAEGARSPWCTPGWRRSMSAPARGAAREARKGGLGPSRVPGPGRGSGEEGLEGSTQLAQAGSGMWVWGPASRLIPVWRTLFVPGVPLSGDLRDDKLLGQ